MKNLVKVFSAIILAMSVAFIGCKKEPATPVVVTSEVTQITGVSAVCGGVVTSDGDSPVTERGVCWSKESNPLVSGSHLVAEEGSGSFTCNLTDLEPNTTYYVKAYAINGAGIAYGSEISFTTLEEDHRVPEVTMVEVTDITPVSAIGKAIIDDEGGSVVTEKGICWSEEESPTIYDSRYVSTDIWNTYEGILSNLQPNTTYYVRAYAINSYGVGYSSVLSFNTQEVVVPPTIEVLAEENYLFDGCIVAVGETYNYGFHMASDAGLSSLNVLINDDLADVMDLSGAVSYDYRNIVVFGLDKEIIGECTITAEVTDVNGHSNSASFTVFIDYEQILEASPFEWRKDGAASAVGLEEFGLSWEMNSKDIYARIRPLEGVTLFQFDPYVWSDVTTGTDKAMLFTNALETTMPLYEYAHVSAMSSQNYDDVIGTILPNGNLYLLHITHAEISVDKMTHIMILGESK